MFICNEKHIFPFYIAFSLCIGLPNIKLVSFEKLFVVSFVDLFTYLITLKYCQLNSYVIQFIEGDMCRPEKEELVVDASDSSS